MSGREITAHPQIGKKTVVIPILKPSKPAEEINSYRPISLTSVLAKIKERMVMGRLNWYLETTTTDSGTGRLQAKNFQQATN
jgi:hypothetical protein